MTDQSVEDRAIGPEIAVPAAGEVHNSVLIRTHEPVRTTHSWVVPALLGVAVIGAGAIWGVMATHPSGPLVNHAVSDAPPSFATAHTG